MALTVSNVQIVNDGPTRIRTGLVTFDSSYNASGESLTAAMFGLQSIDQAIVGGMTAGGFAVRWDQTNTKLWLYGNATSTTTNPVAAFSEVVASADASALTVPVTVYGH